MEDIETLPDHTTPAKFLLGFPEVRKAIRGIVEDIEEKGKDADHADQMHASALEEILERTE